MGQLFRLFESPTLVTSVREAVSLVARQSSQAARAPLAHFFESWRYAMVEACPDLSAEDPYADRSDNAWPRGLPERYDRAVYTFEANPVLLGDGLMGLIAGVAGPLGLYVLDARGGLLYRPDQQVLGLDGRLRPPPPAVVPPATQANLLRDGDASLVVDGLRQQLAACLAPFGFEFVADAQGRPATLERRAGGIVQAVSLTGFFNHHRLVLVPEYLLYAPQVTESWRPVAGDAYDACVKVMERYSGSRLDYFSLTGGELCAPDAAEYGPYRYGTAQTQFQTQRWFDGFARHVVEQALPRLDRLVSPRGLAERLHTTEQRERMFRRNDIRPPEQFGRLVLIHTFDVDHAAEWHEALFDHCGRSNWSHMGWQNVRGLLERLIAHLESPAFDSSALREAAPKSA